GRRLQLSSGTESSRRSTQTRDLQNSAGGKSLKGKRTITAVLNCPPNPADDPFHPLLRIKVLARRIAHLIRRHRPYSSIVLEDLLQSLAEHPRIQHLAQQHAPALPADCVRADDELLGAR